MSFLGGGRDDVFFEVRILAALSQHLVLFLFQLGVLLLHQRLNLRLLLVELLLYFVELEALSLQIDHLAILDEVASVGVHAIAVVVWRKYEALRVVPRDFKLHAAHWTHGPSWVFGCGGVFSPFLLQAIVLIFGDLASAFVMDDHFLGSYH